MNHQLSTEKFDQKRLCHNFFPSYHGHSLADAHAAIIKRALTTRYLETEVERMAFLKEATWGPTSVAEMASVLRSRCSATEVHIFDHIQRKAQHRPDIQPLQAIKSNHCFVYEHNSCNAFAKTGDEQPTAQDFKFKSRKHRRLKLVRRAEGWVACRCDE